MTDYQIVIPSYKRAKTLKLKTLNILENVYIPNLLDRLHIFVANKTELKAYKKELDPKYHKCLKIGKKGMKQIRNFITDYFPENTKLVCMDDDIEKIIELVKEPILAKDRADGKPKPAIIRELVDLDKLIKNGFMECDKKGLRLWGIYPANNAYFLRFRVTYDLRYIVGSFWGCYNTKKIRITVPEGEKEDYERTIKYYLDDDGVVRFQHITIKTRYCKEPGGMQETRNDERIKKVTLDLHQKYPKLTRIVYKQQGKFMDLRLYNSRK